MGERQLALSGEKWCGLCCALKPLDEFYRRKASKDGRSYRCKDCSTKNNNEEFSYLSKSTIENLLREGEKPSL